MNRLFSLASLTTLFWVTGLASVNAQLVPDNTLGSESSVVTPNVNIRNINSDRIDGGAVRGNNLFHSFQEFNVEAGRGVYFSNPETIINILTRVTGDNLSNILGTLGVLGNANLFLINPNGIVFGPNARLDVGGSFFASTADSILFENGVEFAASNPQAPPLLTINIPIGLNLRDNPGNITVQGEGNNFTVDPNQSANLIPSEQIEGLQVSPGQTLALVGGDINLTGGNLIAATGRIELGSVQSGEVTFSDPINQDFNYQNVTQFGNIQLSEAASVNVLGEGGGRINVQGQSIRLSDGSVIIADTSGGIPGGGLNLFAVDTLELIGSSPQQVPSGLFANISPTGTAPGGTILVETGNLVMNQGGKIAADTFGDGIGGNITINAQQISLDDNSQISTGAFERGNSGTLTLNSQNLTLQNNSRILANSSGEGNGGILVINAENITLQEMTFETPDPMPQTSQIAAESRGIGKSGDITITTNTLTVDGGTIRVDANAEGDAGSLTVNANTITITGVNSRLSANTSGTGNAGELEVNAQQLTINNEGRISSRTTGRGDGGTLEVNTDSLVLENGSQIRVNTEAEGEGGSLTITAQDITITGLGSGLFADANGTGNAGELEVNTQQLTVNNEGRISSRTTGNMMNAGSAGSLEINTDSLVLDTGDIRVSTDGAGNAGNLIVRANDMTLTGVDAGLFAGVAPMATGVGGTITIETQNLNLSNNAEIQAGTAGIGDAGNLIINADNLNLSNDAEIQTGTRSAGNAGNLTLNADNILVRDGSKIASDTRDNANGNAGSLTINADNIIIEETAEIPDNPRDQAGILVGTDGAGSAGELEVNSQQLTVNTGGRISSRTEGTGNAGKLEINTDNLTIAGGEIIANTDGSGNAGDLEVTANNITIIGTEVEGLMSGLFADVQREGTGDGGTITIQAQNLNMSNGGEIRAGTFGTGNAGTLTINADSIQVRDGAEISTDTRGSGNGGTLTLNAGSILVEETATIPDEPRERAEISVETGGTGNAGELEVNTQQLAVNNGGRISSRTTGNMSNSGNAGTLEINTAGLTLVGGEIQADTAGAGNAGDLEITANNITIIGTEVEDLMSGLFADVQPGGTGDGGIINIQTQTLNISNDGEIRAGTVGSGNAGDLNINAQTVQVRDGAEISTDTRGSGNAGRLTINADNITVEQTTTTTTPPRETARIIAETEGSGDSGIVTLNSQQLTVNNGGRVSSRTEGTGNAGTLNISTENLTVEGGEIQADTTNRGNAGNINVTANDVEIIGTQTEGQVSGLFADVQPTGTGNGGTVTVNTGNLTVRDGGEIRVQSRGAGNAGSINATAANIRLDRQGQLSARSATGQGGNITLEANDIRLRRQSEIEASGSENNPTLDGNITITTSLLILLEGSSITTNAFDPAGGSNIAIRALEGSNLTVIQSQTSTINAAGDLTIDTTLNFDPPETLNVEVINPEALIAQTPCQEGDESEFIITGRGGLPPNPTQGTRQRGVSLSLTEPVQPQNLTPSNSNRQRSRNPNVPLSSEDIVPARGWIRNEQGEIILVGYDPTKTQPQRQIRRLNLCSPRH